MRLLLESTLALDCQFNVGHLDGVIARRTSGVGRAWCGCWTLKCKIEATRILEFWIGNFWSGQTCVEGRKPQRTSHSSHSYTVFAMWMHPEHKPHSIYSASHTQILDWPGKESIM